MVFLNNTAFPMSFFVRSPQLRTSNGTYQTLLTALALLAFMGTPITGHAQGIGDTGGGIIYYGNGTVVTNPPPQSAPVYVPPATNGGYSSVQSQTACPPTVFPNPPQPCANPAYNDPYGYGDGGVYGDGWGAPVVVGPYYGGYGYGDRTPERPMRPKPPTSAGPTITTVHPSIATPPRTPPARTPRSSNGGVPTGNTPTGF